ncbi:MAG: flagellar motor switch protein FliN [Rhodothermales bacterium]|nr:flagellar motor switch protein FliN [Rhodothermales bacterium]
MTDSQILSHYADQAAESLSDFVGTLLGKEALVTTRPPAHVTPADVSSEAAAQYTVLSKGTGNEAFAVQLPADWLAPFSQAMLGIELSPTDPDSADLFVELASQAFGAVRNVLGRSVSIPEVYFEALAPGAPVPADRLQANLVRIPFDLRTEAGSFTGSITLSDAILSALPVPPSETAEVVMPGSPSPAKKPPVDVSQASFPDLGRERIVNEGGGGNFQMLAEVELNVTVELGRRNIPLSDVLRLTTGSVIELEKLVGEPLEIYANGRLIAEGEAVVIDEQFGVRVTNLAAARQRAGAFM